MRQTKDTTWFQSEAVGRLVVADLFAYKNPVIPVMTRGRAYGSISKRLLQIGASIPHVPLEGAKFVDPYIFTALWDDESTYTPERIFNCALNALGAASRNGVPLLAFPLLGGNMGYKYLWAAENGIFVQADALQEMGFPIPEHVYVTDRPIS